MKQTVAEITRVLREQGKAFNDAADRLNEVAHDSRQPHGNTGRHMSVETRKKMSDSQKARHEHDHEQIA